MAPSLNLTLGPIVVGVVIGVFLYGIASVQAYQCLRSGSAKDKRWLRILVQLVWSVPTLITVFTCMYLFSLTVINYGEVSKLSILTWPVSVSFFLGGIASAIVQSFFAWRVHVLSGRWFVSVVSWTGSVARIGITLAICIITIQQPDLKIFEIQFPYMIILSLTVSMSIDILNTVSLCYCLHHLRTGWGG
ncbi:hypothetical protein GGX14DRAFT_380653 [Mycena pura]|uniref:Uncharacterized protein n=1 Tax=Mycena pura TaxID=153505 RepID=A0AAD6UPC4_9AGAR|nr:hypothetical protein GGX14DRAFT_380653 [Mycena pura]